MASQFTKPLVHNVEGLANLAVIIQLATVVSSVRSRDVGDSRVFPDVTLASED